MGHKLTVKDIVAIVREVELPDICPKCGVAFGYGDYVEAMTAVHVKERLRLTHVFVGDASTDAVEVKEVTMVAQSGGFGTHMRRSYRCLNCQCLLHSSILRQYALAEMEPWEAAKLRGLLYDSNVTDPVVQRMCYPELQKENNENSKNTETTE